MANSIQDIESVDDYWSFRQILESTSYDKTLDQLENRLKALDKEIEKICSLYYQGFIENTKELLQVKSQAKVLHDQIMTLDEELRSASEGRGP